MNTIEKFNANAAFIARQLDAVTDLRRTNQSLRVELLAAYERIDELESKIKLVLASDIVGGSALCLVPPEALDLLHDEVML